MTIYYIYIFIWDSKCSDDAVLHCEFLFIPLHGIGQFLIFLQQHHLLLWICIVLHKQENILCICTFPRKVKLHETPLTIQHKINHNMMHDVFCCSLRDRFHRHLLFYPIKILCISRCITHNFLADIIIKHLPIRLWENIFTT